MNFKRIGMRTVKTSLAVTVTIIISELLDMESPFFASIAAIIAMKASVSESFTMGKNRMLGTIFGAIIALFFSYTIPINALSIGIGILVIIYTCNLFGWKNAIQMSTIVFLSIILNYEEGRRLNYALYRTFDTLVGLVIGTVINYFIAPPDTNQQKLIKESADDIYSKVKSILESLIIKSKKESLDELKAKLDLLEEEYAVYKKETKLNILKDKDSSKFITDYNKTINYFHNIHGHLNTIFSMESIPSLSEKNRKALESIFEKELPSQESDAKDTLYIVYNYHIDKIIEEIKLLKTINAM